MRHKLKELLLERDIEIENFPIETLYKVGLDNVRNNIEFYYDKTYTCESVIKELFIRGIIDYIQQKSFLVQKNKVVEAGSNSDPIQKILREI